MMTAPKPLNTMNDIYNNYRYNNFYTVMHMETNMDDWCPFCTDWMLHYVSGKCLKCGTFIDKKLKNYSWFERFGIEPDELTDGDF